MRSYPHKPNRARRAQSVHVPNCGYVPNRGNGARQRIITLPVAEGHHAASGTPQSTACEVYPNKAVRFLGTLDRSVERSRASPRSGRSKGPSDATRPRGGVTRKGEPSGPGYTGHILRMCRRPLCPFLRCIKFLLMQRLTCPIRRFSGFTGGEMNFHKSGQNCCVFCGNNSTLWISPPFSRLFRRFNFHIVRSEATHGGKLCGGCSGTSVSAQSFPFPPQRVTFLFPASAR